MQREEAIKVLLNAANYFEQQAAGYKSWGKVEVVQIGIRLQKNKFLITEKNASLASLTVSEIMEGNINSFFHQIFSKRKKVQIILVTQQEYASKVKHDIPPILDDQAQLLGVSVRIAKSEKDVEHSLCGRSAAILPEGRSICIGNNIEEAYVAAQLLEKTSKAFIEAEHLGGAKPINKLEAWLMHKFYQFKYSKETNKNR